MQIANPQAHFSYEILEKFEAGLVLTGSEVKSIRQGQASLKESFAKLAGGEAWLMNMHIAPYSHGDTTGYEPNRPRKLLLSKKELTYLTGKTKEQGLALVPLKLYWKKNHLKAELALARGKKKYDKRATIREREVKQKTARLLRRKV